MHANIVLVGFMGSGKSSVGRLLAQKLGFQFTDTDRMVAQQAGADISAIFAERGEKEFRELEHEALVSLRGKAGLVVATGGGIVTTARNLAVLKELGMVVWLRASEEAVWDRVSRNDRRPLLRTADPRATIRELLALRTPMYAEAAEMEIDTSLLSHAEVAERIWGKYEV